ncbi:MAG: hypothetical protein VXZ38_10500, partial [Planctomycetota bacterium]|nr:hypothetical protein [Planctomycetota bacterium]
MKDNLSTARIDSVSKEKDFVNELTFSIRPKYPSCQKTCEKTRIINKEDICGPAQRKSRPDYTQRQSPKIAIIAGERAQKMAKRPD